MKFGIRRLENTVLFMSVMNFKMYYFRVHQYSALRPTLYDLSNRRSSLNNTLKTSVKKYIFYISVIGFNLYFIRAQVGACMASSS